NLSRAEILLTSRGFLCNFYALDSRSPAMSLKICPERKFCSLREVFCAVFTLWTDQLDRVETFLELHQQDIGHFSISIHHLFTTKQKQTQGTLLSCRKIAERLPRDRSARAAQTPSRSVALLPRRPVARATQPPRRPALPPPGNHSKTVKTGTNELDGAPAANYNDLGS
ncbi:MAG: hypothetical protein QM296_04020, partial [Bacillota bacterium]|nr:hypothetical protein [Bacillota bacterium]